MNEKDWDFNELLRELMGAFEPAEGDPAEEALEEEEAEETSAMDSEKADFVFLELARLLYGHYTSFVEAGFSEAQAMYLTGEVLKSIVGGARK